MMVVMHDRAVTHPMMRHAVMDGAVMHDVVAVTRGMRRGDTGRGGEHHGGQRQGHEFHELFSQSGRPESGSGLRKATLAEDCYNLTPTR